MQGTWKIDFIEGGPELPKAYAVERLTSWTESADPTAKVFAGTVRYSLDFQLHTKEANDWVLDLGDVRESARVRINGHLVGTLFALPFRVRISGLLKPGQNSLEIEVTNLAANRIRAQEQANKSWKIMRDINIVNVEYQEFNPATWPAQPMA